MKKYLLTALLWVFGLCTAFASATDFTFSMVDEYTYTPSSFESDGWTFQLKSFVVPTDDDYDIGSYCYFWLEIDNTQVCSIDIDIEDNSVSENTCNWYNVPEWTVSMSSSVGSVCKSITFSIGSSSEWWDSWGSLLPWWEWDLSWIISWLNSVIDEFLPYLVYIWLGLITATIWFIAIRWLVNRTSSKVRWTFSSWKRRR